MKKQRDFIFLSLLFTAVAMGLLPGCTGGGDPEPVASEAEEVTEILTGATWKLNAVIVDGADQTNVYKGLTLTFTGTSITTSNGGMVWPASTTWKFTNETATAIERGDGVKVSIVEAHSGKLSLALTWSKTTLGSGRVNSVKGEHTFSFGK
jgi:hypothetical protein